MSAKLYIPKPCHENWDKMTPADKGRHCDVCSKVVKDLTGLNKIQAVQILANSGKKEICGRVDTAILDVHSSKWDTFFTYMKRYGIRALAFIGIIVMDQKVNAQTEVFYPTTGLISMPITKNKVESKKYRIHVIIKDEQGVNVQFAHIEISGKSQGKVDGMTNQEGISNIHFNEDEMGGNDITIGISCMGFETKILNGLYITKTNTTLEVILKTQVTELPEYNLVDNKKIICGKNEHGHTAGMMVMYNITSMGLVSVDGVRRVDSTSTDESLNSGLTKEPLQFKCYPDPTDGIFIIECNKNHVFDLQIFDNSGKMLAVMFQVANRKEIDLSGNSPGIYYVTILENGKVMDTKKVILVK